jgi:hypothetical protein
MTLNTSAIAAFLSLALGKLLLEIGNDLLRIGQGTVARPAHFVNLVGTKLLV